MNIRFGTRGSALALWQTRYVMAELTAANATVTAAYEIYSTKGDRVIDVPLPQVGGKGLFTAELEAALHAGDIDCAVHMPATLSLGSGELSPGMESALMGLEEGVRTTFELASGVAFGDRNPDMQQWVARKLLAQLGAAQEHYVPGDVVQFPTPDGHGTYAGAVMQVADDGAVLFDFNHPLAGHPVTFEVHVIGIL